MNSNISRHDGLFLGVLRSLRAQFVSSFLTLLLVIPLASGCDLSPTARQSTSGSTTTADGLSIDERSGAPPSDILFEAPVRIFAGENPVSVDEPGYACPTIADVDGDGADDLVVGQFANGQMKFYRNENAPEQTPKFAEGVWIKTGDEVASVPGVW